MAHCLSKKEMLKGLLYPWPPNILNSRCQPMEPPPPSCNPTTTENIKCKENTKFIWREYIEHQSSFLPAKNTQKKNHKQIPPISPEIFVCSLISFQNLIDRIYFWSTDKNITSGFGLATGRWRGKLLFSLSVLLVPLPPWNFLHITDYDLNWISDWS